MEQVAATTTSFKDLPPEIQSMIGQFLNPHDMTVCARVCQAWKALFIPYIWRHVKSSDSMNWTSMKYVLWRCIDSPLYGLRENAQRIQSMTIYFDIDANDPLFHPDGYKYKGFDKFLDVCPVSFPRLTTARLFGLNGRGDLVADLIRRGSPAGWREITLRLFFWVCQEDRTVRSAPEMVSAIFGQASTLTALQLDGGGYVSSKDIQQLLCTAPNLRKFHLLGHSRTKESPDPCLNAADVQSEWVCLDLEVFGCAIGGIPRWDITLWVNGEPTSEYTIKGSSNDSIDLQRRVYSQLGRLVKLKELSLGSPIEEFVASDYDEYEVDDFYREDSPLRQFDCLTMSLESGLDLLKDLKELRSVKLVDMEVYVEDDKEQAWISEHWPNALVET